MTGSGGLLQNLYCGAFSRYVPCEKKNTWEAGQGGQGPDSHVSFGDFGGAFRDLKDLVASRHGRVLHEHPTSGLARRVVCRFGSTPHTIETLQGPNKPIDEMPELEAEDTRDAPTGYGHSA